MNHQIVYSICYGNEVTSSSVSDVDCCAIITKLVDRVLNTFRYSHIDEEPRHNFTGHFFHKVARTRHDAVRF
jgi:hypothetical protein